MGTTLHLADGEEFILGRSREKATELVELAAAAGLKGSVKTTYNGYIVPSVIFTHGVPDEDAEKHEEPGTTPDKIAEEILTDPAKADEDVDADADTDEDADENKAVQFDPTAATIAEVTEYLDGADDDERARVIAAESASAKPRRGVLDLAATKEGK